ncbi:MAG: AMP-binding protein [Syntrophales bacterium]|nr:AMP-binding protein [Syntrophales bacterium]
MHTLDKPPVTIPQMLIYQAHHLDDKVYAIREKAYGIWQTYTWRDYLEYTKKTALGLKRLGVNRGDIVAIVTDNIPEWLFTEIGAQSIGCTTINLFTSSIPEELCFSLNRVEATCVVVQNQEQADKMLEIRNKTPHVRKVVVVDTTGMRDYWQDPWFIPFREVLKIGERADSETPEEFYKEVRRGKADDIAVMIQTSGTTGVSKQAMLTHRGLLAMGRKWKEALNLEPGENWLSMSPPAWIVDQMWGLGVALVCGMTMNFPETPETISEDFREIGPAVIVTSSRFWEDMASRIRVKMSDAGYIKRKLFTWAELIGRRVIDYRFNGSDIPLHYKVLHRFSSFVIYKPLLDRIGCLRLRAALTGGHPISPDVIKFFQAIGLNLKQCYGLTEGGGIFQVQPDNEVKLETVGKPLPGVTVRLSPEQEVQVKSDTLFAGYYKDYRATEAAFTEDGFLRTGDAGYIDQNGHLIIIGRKEDIIRDKRGNAFSPDFIETRLKFSPYIKEAVVFGEGRPYITALINIDMENVGNWAEERLIPFTTYMDLTQREEVEELIKAEVKSINNQLPEVMRIKKFILLFKLLDADDEELTRTGKVRRRFIYGVYIDLIEAMYRPGTEKVKFTGKIRYRDGRVGEVSTTVRIIDVDTSEGR